MKITYMGKPLEEQPRRSNGQYKSKHQWFWILLFIIFAIFAFAFTMHSDYLDLQEGIISYTAPLQAESKPDRLEVKIETLKSDLVESLAKNCETKGVAEPDAALIFDSNNQASVGAWQWQIKSIQHYAKKFYGQDITRVEAIALATNHEKAKELTTKVIFEEGTGHLEWVNCFRSLGLKSKVEFINELDK